MALVPNAMRAAGLGWGADWIRMLRGGRGGGGGGGAPQKSEMDKMNDLLNKQYAYPQDNKSPLLDELDAGEAAFNFGVEAVPNITYDSDTDTLSVTNNPTSSKTSSPFGGLIK